MSTAPEPIFSSMWRELTVVGLQAVVFAVGVTTVEMIDYPGVILLKWPLLITAIIKICSIYKPRTRQGNARLQLHEYPMAQALINFFLLVMTTLALNAVSDNHNNLTEQEIENHGKMVNGALQYLNSLTILLGSRFTFLVVDNMFGGGQLSQLLRTMVRKEVEGVPITNDANNNNHTHQN